MPSPCMHGRRPDHVSRAVHVPARPSVVEVVSPGAVVAALDVVAGRVVGDEAERGGGDEAVVAVHHLHVAEVGGAVGALAGEVPTPHLRGRVRPRRPRVHHLAAELHHVGVPAQVREQERRPVPHQLTRRPQLQPPVPPVWVLPYEQADVELPAVVDRGRRDSGSNGDPVVRLDEAGAVQVVAPGLLVCVGRPICEEPGAAISVQFRAHLPSGLDGVEVVAEGAGDDPDLGEAELRRRRHLGGPHVQAGLGAVELVPRHVPHRVLVAAAGRVAAGVVAGPGLHPEPPGGAGAQHVARRRPPYRHRPLRAPLAAVAPRLREHVVVLLLLGSAADALRRHGPLHGLVLGLLASEHGVVEGRLEVRRHAADDVSVGALDCHVGVPVHPGHASHDPPVRLLALVPRGTEERLLRMRMRPRGGGGVVAVGARCLYPTPTPTTSSSSSGAVGTLAHWRSSACLSSSSLPRSEQGNRGLRTLAINTAA
uniref:Uncharacterized protein n=1 Tax=Zea mays TaxID=4577 RepID=B7ZZN3_MAIZE|nr:unknown [Zea mays]